MKIHRDLLKKFEAVYRSARKATEMPVKKESFEQAAAVPAILEASRSALNAARAMAQKLVELSTSLDLPASHNIQSHMVNPQAALDFKTLALKELIADFYRPR